MGFVLLKGETQIRWWVCKCVFVSVCLYLSVCVSVRLSVNLSFSLYIYTFFAQPRVANINCRYTYWALSVFKTLSLASYTVEPMLLAHRRAITLPTAPPYPETYTKPATRTPPSTLQPTYLSRDPAHRLPPHRNCYDLDLIPLRICYSVTKKKYAIK